MCILVFVCVFLEWGFTNAPLPLPQPRDGSPAGRPTGGCDPPRTPHADHLARLRVCPKQIFAQRCFWQFSEFLEHISAESYCWVESRPISGTINAPEKFCPGVSSPVAPFSSGCNPVSNLGASPVWPTHRVVRALGLNRLRFTVSTLRETICVLFYCQEESRVSEITRGKKSDRGWNFSMLFFLANFYKR